VLQEGKQISTTAAHSMELNDLHTGDQLPVAQHCKDQQQQLALPATATGFPHEYRYCYWSNELYHPRKASPYVMLSGGDAQQDAPPAALAEVSSSCTLLASAVLFSDLVPCWVIRVLCQCRV
jgi:hypothetical protein